MDRDMSLRQAARPALISGVVGILAVLALATFITFEAGRAIRESMRGFYFFGSLNDLLLAVQALLLLPLAVAFYRQARGGRLNALALATGLIGLCGAAAGHALYATHVLNQSIAAVIVTPAWAAVGLWLLFVNRPGALATDLTPGLARLGQMAGAGLILQLVCFLVFGGGAALLSPATILSHYALLVGMGLGFAVGLLGLTAWSIALARAFSGVPGSRWAVHGL